MNESEDIKKFLGMLARMSLAKKQYQFVLFLMAGKMTKMELAIASGSPEIYVGKIIKPLVECCLVVQEPAVVGRGCFYSLNMKYESGAVDRLREYKGKQLENQLYL